jgi:5-methylcytosine-specific restriction endonuclease McrA
MPTRLSLEPGCPNPVTGRGRCDQHRKPIERDRSRQRREATKGTYKTRRWQLRRMQVFTHDPFCADGRVCGGKAPSVEVDPVTPLDRGGDPYRMDNLRGTCRDCHEAKTAEENRGRGV